MQAQLRTSGLANSTSLQARPSRARFVTRATADFQVRPYTLRKGDSLESIAKKRSLTVGQVLGVNPDLNTAKLAEGATILLPAGKLSSRDKEILAGIGTGYRVYPVRAGETLNDIISKRKITIKEIQSLNPGININKVEAGQVLKLPAGKFTVREREMLMGIVPAEFFEATKNPFVIGGGLVLGVCGFVLAWMKFYRDPDFDDDDLPADKTKA